MIEKGHRKCPFLYIFQLVYHSTSVSTISTIVFIIEISFMHEVKIKSKVIEVPTYSFACISTSICCITII